MFRALKQSLPLLAAVAGLACGMNSPAGAVDWPAGTRTAVTLSFDLDAETVWWDDPERMTGAAGRLPSRW